MGGDRHIGRSPAGDARGRGRQAQPGDAQGAIGAARARGRPDAGANAGTLVPNKDLTEGTLQAPGVAARCDVRGFLLIGGEPPELGPYVLPGNNYHVYDYALYWRNIRADAAARLNAFLAASPARPAAARR